MTTPAHSTAATMTATITHTHAAALAGSSHSPHPSHGATRRLQRWTGSLIARTRSSTRRRSK